LEPTTAVWQPRPKFQDRVWLHVLLFALTAATTTFYGALHYLAFLADFAQPPPGDSAFSPGISISTVAFWLHGLWYSGTVLAILGCHELGHYVACRYYGVDASRPFFIPVPPPLFYLGLVPIPPPVMTGTLGAFIRIREPIPSKRILFDIGIAGPIAGFVVAVPALFIGLALSHLATVPPNFSGFALGEPLLFKLGIHLFFGARPPGVDVNLHPMAFAAWFGFLATALNLFPVGQLDGGHITYSVLGRRSSTVTLVTLVVAIGLTYSSPSWFVWTTLMVVMLVAFGRHHPRVFDEDVPLDFGRLMMALFALAMFVLCFTPAPIELIGR
jgi:membrane-associated protease RseP (regulator of RpoE activity)